MKLSAISSRGSRKDFICVMKGLLYFKDADEQGAPLMFKRANWRTVKKAIIEAHDDYIKRFNKR